MGSIWEIDLPRINGVYEAGIAIGVDPTLSQGLKLPVLTKSTRERAIKYAVLKAYGMFRGDAAVTDTMRFYAAAAAYGLISTDCIRLVGNNPDGDWIPTEDAGFEGSADDVRTLRRILGAITVDVLRDALLLALATKVNWWLTNHHTGQGPLQSFVKKIVDLKFKDQPQDGWATVIHTIGHWASSLYILKLGGIEGLRRTSHIASWRAPVDGAEQERSTLKVGAEAKLRLASMPAGTHRLAVAHAGALRLMRSPLILVCPDPSSFDYIPYAREQVLESPASHHIGAYYLTGDDRADFQDTFQNGVLGRIGTFVIRTLAKSTLAESPHLSEKAVTGYEDYDANWDSICRNYRLMAISDKSEKVRALTGLVGNIDHAAFLASLNKWGMTISPIQEEALKAFSQIDGGQYSYAASATPPHDEREMLP